MSCDWNIHCLDCKVTHTFDNANHCEDLMLFLIRHADSIAALAELENDQTRRHDVELRTTYGPVSAMWFCKHLGHNLAPIDEYGHILGRCTKWVACTGCDTQHPCVLNPEHVGPCLPKVRA